MKSFLEWLQTRLEWEDDEISIRGEYWIDEGGNAQFADGDVGDVNHEGMVINTLQRSIAGDQYDKGEYVDWDQFKADLAERIYQSRLSQADPASQQELTAQYEDDPESFIDEAGMEEEGIDAEAFSYAEGRGDAREYGMKHWRWKRVKGHDVETWTFDDKDKSIIAEGLSNIIYEDVGEVDEEQFNQIEFYIYVHTSGQSFDVTIPELEGKQAAFTSTPNQQGTGQMSFGTSWMSPSAQQPVASPSPQETPQTPDQTSIPQPYEDEESQQKFRPVNADINLQQKAARNFQRQQDTINMPKFYQGHIGDWYVPQ